MFTPRFTVDQSDEAMVITGDLPGVLRNSVKITLHKGGVTVSAQRVCRGLEGGARRTIDEREGGAFSRTFTIPFTVTPPLVLAELVDGVLIIRAFRSHAHLAKEGHSAQRIFALQTGVFIGQESGRDYP